MSLPGYNKKIVIILFLFIYKDEPLSPTQKGDLLERVQKRSLKI